MLKMANTGRTEIRRLGKAVEGQVKTPRYKFTGGRTGVEINEENYFRAKVLKITWYEACPHLSGTA
jgi:hypothetical protein